MPAYIIADVKVTDPVRYDEYRPLAAAAIAAHGGRYLARGGTTVRLEGREPNRIVILEFPDLATAQRFHDSEQYRLARAKREGACEPNLLIVDGYVPAP